jgi:hypothetical protein
MRLLFAPHAHLTPSSSLTKEIVLPRLACAASRTYLALAPFLPSPISKPNLVAYDNVLTACT